MESPLDLDFGLEGFDETQSIDQRLKESLRDLKPTIPWSEMSLPKSLWKTLTPALVQALDVFGQDHPHQLRRMTLWEAVYVASGMTPPRSPLVFMAMTSYEEMIKSVIYKLVEYEIYPDMIIGLRRSFVERDATSKVQVGYMAGSNAVDAIIEPIMQHALDSFKMSGAIGNETSGLTMVRQFLDFSPKIVPQTTLFYATEFEPPEDQLELEADRLISTRFEVMIDRVDVAALRTLDHDWYHDIFDDGSLYLDYIVLRLVIDMRAMLTFNVSLDQLHKDLTRLKVKGLDPLIVSSPIQEDLEGFHMYIDLITQHQSHLLGRAPREITVLLDERVDMGLQRPAWYATAQRFSWNTNRSLIAADTKCLRLYLTDFDPEIFNSLTVLGVFKKLNDRQDYETVFDELWEETFAMMPPPIVIVDVYPATSDGVGAIFMNGVFDAISQTTISYEDSMRILWNNQVMPLVNRIVVGGRDGITNAQVAVLYLGEAVKGSTRVDNRRWKLFLNHKLLMEYRVRPVLERALGDRRRWTTATGDLVVESDEDPMTLITGEIPFIQAMGGDFVKILNDPLFDPRYAYTTNINSVIETLGVEAARNAIVKGLSDTLSTESLSPRHIVLYADLVTRSGHLTKTVALGGHEPVSVLEISSLKSPLQQIKSSVLSRNEPVSDIGSAIYMGGVPRVGNRMRLEALASAGRQVAPRFRIQRIEPASVPRPRTRRVDPPVAKRPARRRPLRVIDVMTSDVLEAVKDNEVAEVDCEPSSSEIQPIETEIPEFLR